MPEMGWIDWAWPMIAGACLTLGAVHLLIGVRRRSSPANLLFACSAASVAGIAVLELAMMQAASPLAFETALRWAHLPVVALQVSLIGFVLLHVGSRHLWLARTAGLVALACLWPNFATGSSIDYLSLDAVQLVAVRGGAAVVVPSRATINPWSVLESLGLALFLLFLLLVTIEVAQRHPSPSRTRALRVCSVILVFAMVATAWTGAVLHGLVTGPLVLSPCFLFVIVMMGFELGTEVLHARETKMRLEDAQHTLQDTQRRVNQAVEAADIGLWNIDLANGHAWLSARALAMLEPGPRSRVRAKRLLRRIHPADRQRVHQALAAAAWMDGEFSCEFRVTQPGTAVRWVAAHGQVVFDAEGRATKVDGLVIDVTDRHHAEDRFRTVCETVPVAILLVDSEGTVSLANAEAERLLRRSRDRLVGVAARRILPPDFDRPDHAATADAAPAYLRVGRELTLPDEAATVVKLALSHVTVPTGRFTLVSMIDVSATRRMENELAERRDELIHLSRVAMMSELSGSLAHELNQPLTAILANTQAGIRFLAHDPPDLGEVCEGLQNAADSAKRAGEVIRRMRALLRKERGAHQLLDINEVVRDNLMIMRSDLLNRGVELELALADDLPPVLGDKVQLQQVLLNLAINGSDAMRRVPHHRSITIRTRYVPQDSVELAVSDCGTGIPEEDIERIFSPFVTTKNDGLGFGLAVCRTILAAHEGSMRAANNPDHGATVSLRLPAATNIARRV